MALQREVKETEPCSGGTKGEKEPFQESDALPPALPCDFSSASCPHPQQLWHILSPPRPLLFFVYSHAPYIHVRRRLLSFHAWSCAEGEVIRVHYSWLRVTVLMMLFITGAYVNGQPTWQLYLSTVLHHSLVHSLTSKVLPEGNLGCSCLVHSRRCSKISEIKPNKPRGKGTSAVSYSCN